MTDFDAEGDRRAQLREDALQALAVITGSIRRHPGTGQAGRLVRFIAGLYNSGDYPFALDELRGLDTQLLAACLTYLAYDALGEKEVHRHIEGGDETVNAWFVQYDLRPAEPTIAGMDAGSEVVELNAELVTYGHAPGYRGVHFVLDVAEIVGHEKRRIDVHVTGDDAVRMHHHIEEVHRSAWKGRGPIDLRDGETRPGWI